MSNTDATVDAAAILKTWRNSIDNIDAALIHILAERFRCTQEVGKLKAQYNCRAVRFRVVTKDNKVSLKPVPIFE